MKNNYSHEITLHTKLEQKNSRKLDTFKLMISINCQKHSVIIKSPLFIIGKYYQHQNLGF